MSIKVCGTCSAELPLSSFYSNKRNRDGLYNHCKSCVRLIQKRYEERNKVTRRARGLRKIGATLEQYDELFAQQNGKCLICNEPPKGTSRITQNLHVDHDHLTGKIRGLLCNRCNRGIGFFEDKADLLESAYKYLKESNV